MRAIHYFWSLLLILAASGALAQQPEQPAAKAEPVLQEHIIYLPFDKLPEVFEKADSSIMLPYSQFLQMWEQIRKGEKPQVLPPVGAVLKQVNYTAKIDGELVRIAARLDIEVLTDQWAQVPLPLGNAALGKATNEQGAVLLRGLGSGLYELLVKGKGEHQIQLELVTPLERTEGGTGFRIDCPTVGVSNLELVIPQKELTVTITPTQTSRTEQIDEGTRVSAALGATDKFGVHWHPKVDQAAQQAGIANVSSQSDIRVGDGVIQSHLQFSYEILRGMLSELRVSLPPRHRILDVRVPGLRDWQINDQEQGGRELLVQLHAPISGKTTLELRTEFQLPDEPFSLGGIHTVGTARESGIVALLPAADVGLEITARQAITRIDAAEAPEGLRRPRTLFYKYYSPGFQLDAQAEALQPRVIVDSQLTVTLEQNRIVLAGTLRYDVSRAGIFSIQVRLPEDFYLEDVECTGQERHELLPEEQGQLLTVTLDKRWLGQLDLKIRASKPLELSEGELSLPLVEPVNTTREQGLVAVLLPESYDLGTELDSIESARPATPDELVGRGFQVTAPPGFSHAASFAFVQRPVQIGVSLTPRPRRIQTQVATIVTTREDIVQVMARLNYDIQFAGTDTLRFAIDQDLASRVQIEGANIKEKQRAEDPDENGNVIWTVTLHSETLGAYQLIVTYDQPIEIEDQETEFSLTPIRVLDVDRETGEIAVLKDRSLAVTAEPAGLEEIDPRELSSQPDGDSPHLAYKYYRHPANLDMTLTKHEIQEVVRTVVQRAFIEAVAGESGVITVRARYRLISSERQRISISLPEPRILGVTVAGRSVAPEKAAEDGNNPNQKTYYINVARSTGASEPFDISILFETPLPGERLNTTDSFQLKLPQLEKGVKYQRYYVQTWMPEKYWLVGGADGFQRHTKVHWLQSFETTDYYPDPAEGLSGQGETFDFHVEGRDYLFSSLDPPDRLEVRYWHFPSLSVTTSICFILAGALLVPVRFEARLVVAFLLIMAVLFASLFWTEEIKSYLAAGRIGLVAIPLIWLIPLVGRGRRLILARASGSGSAPLSAPPGESDSGGEPNLDSIPDEPDDASEAEPEPRPEEIQNQGESDGSDPEHKPQGESDEQ